MILLNGDDPNCVDVARQLQPLMAGIEEVGMSPHCARKISDVTYTTHGSDFSLSGERFEIPLIGEFNVRNAAMAIAASRFYGVPLDKIRKALKSFNGIARRQEERGEARGIKVIDDFGHHPTAIRETLRALRHRYTGARIWAVFEPRSNTTRRAVFQQELANALQQADGVFISQVARLDQIPENERLNPKAVVESIAASGRPAFYEPDVAHIIKRLVPLLKAKDVVAIFSNGGFDGIHEKLLERLRD
jgi:UDP-N-acetylmuramate: L-alanyl-gamma-D-glutamyl-meso-diaminopimelate ligase